MKALRSVHTEAHPSPRAEGSCLSSAPLSTSISAVVAVQGKVWVSGSGSTLRLPGMAAERRRPCVLSRRQTHTRPGLSHTAPPYQTGHFWRLFHLAWIQEKPSWHLRMVRVIHGTKIFCTKCQPVSQPCGLFPVPPGTRSITVPAVSVSFHSLLGAGLAVLQF